jgi:hypothetical protein
LEWLAFIGGLGIAHHRGLILSIPPIMYAVCPRLKMQIMQTPRKIFLFVLLGLLGFRPYIYLPLRAWAHASWVYGDPGTLGGLWDQFIAREAPGIVSLPDFLAALAGKFDSTNTLLIQEVTRLGLVMRPPTAWIARIAPVSATMLFAAFLAARNFYPIYSLTHDPAGIETIEIARGVPAGSALVVEWGTRYYAIAFAQEAFGELTQFQRADDKADLIKLAASRPITTFDYSMYDLGIGWWEKKLEQRVYLRAAGPQLIQVGIAPKIFTGSVSPTANSLDPSLPGMILDQSLNCTNGAIVLQVDWVALTKPVRDLSVFVHLKDRAGNVIAQGDQRAPVYGWRPLTSWAPREVVYDV